MFETIEKIGSVAFKRVLNLYYPERVVCLLGKRIESSLYFDTAHGDMLTAFVEKTMWKNGKPLITVDTFSQYDLPLQLMNNESRVITLDQISQAVRPSRFDLLTVKYQNAKYGLILKYDTVTGFWNIDGVTSGYSND